MGIIQEYIGPKLNGIWALKPYYLGPWTLRACLPKPAYGGYVPTSSVAATALKAPRICIAARGLREGGLGLRV